MTDLAREARVVYPDRVTDREPDTGYSIGAWLEPKPAAADDWLAAAFSVTQDPALTGRFRRRAG